MYRRRFIQVAPYLLALLLTAMMVIPRVTTAQDDGTAPEDQTSAEASVGWKVDGRNVYVTNASVGIGDRPESLRDIQLQITEPKGDVGILLKTINNQISALYFREHDLDNGFTVAYDGSAANPSDGSSSGLFGIWRVNGPSAPPSPVLTAYRHTDNVGIGTLPHQDPAIRLNLAGNQLIQGPDGFDEYGEEAQLYLGDLSHYLKVVHGTGIQIGTWQAPDAVTLQQGSGNLGIGTSSPKAKLDIAGESGVAGLQLTLSASEENLPGHVNSPMIRWDSTAYPGVDKIWYSRAQGNEWVLSSSSPDYADVNTIIRVKPDGEICLGSGC